MYHYYHKPIDNGFRQLNYPFFSQFFYPNWNPGFTGQWQFPEQGQIPGQSSQYPGVPGNSPGHGSPSPSFPSGQSASAPQTPPPLFTPEQPLFQTKAIDPGAIRGCLYRFTYIWLDRESFWFYPIFVGRNSVSGFRWYRFRWVYFGIDLNRIQSFQCF